jgi:hypothetical protein
MRTAFCWTTGLALFLGCGQSRAEATASVQSEPASAVAADAAAPPMESKGVAAGAPMLLAQALPAPTQAPMITRSAELSLQVRSVADAVDSLTAITRRANGFVGTSRRWTEGQSERVSATVRVPAAALDDVLATLRRMAVRVDNEAITSEDVTRQAVDLTARLANLRATESELRALLVTVRQRTQRAADILEVHERLSTIRGEIEQHTASLQLLTQQVALSTVTVMLYPDAVAAPIASLGWQPKGVLRDAIRSLVAALRVGATVGIWALVWALPIVAAGIGLRQIFRAVRQRRQTAAAN